MAQHQSIVYLLGKANVGKTSLFNILTNSNNKVANYHGATTTLSKKRLKTDDSIIVYDLPGTYSINGVSDDELLSLETLKNSKNGSTWLFVIDGLDFRNQFKNIFTFISQLPLKNVHLLFAINMIDEVEKNNIIIDTENLIKKLKINFIPISAKKNKNIESIIENLKDSKNTSTSSTKDISKKALEINLDDYHTQQDNLILKRTHFIDKFLISPITGPFFFILIMITFFQSVFSLAAPLMDLINESLVSIAQNLSPLFENTYLKSFIEDAIFGGLGAFLVFAPQIFILSFLIKYLEESGYLSRAAIITHKVLKSFGLSGESFIPLLTSHACAIPGIYAAKHIKSKTVKLITLITLPLTVCSAKLPVYTLLITILLPNTLYLGGFVGLRGLMLFALYLLGALFTLLLSFILYKSLPNNKTENLFILELPRYQFPDLKVCLKEGLQNSYGFIKDAGFLIFITNCFVWILATFPNGPGNLESSYLGQLGKFLAPISQPIGLNWPETVALLTSFLARETFVSTLGTLYGVGAEDIMSLSEMMLQNLSSHPIASTLSLIMFFAVALQCISTLALLKKELHFKNAALYLFSGYLILAYILSFLTYRISLIIF